MSNIYDYINDELIFIVGPRNNVKLQTANRRGGKIYN